MKMVFRMQWFEGKQLVQQEDSPPIEFNNPLHAVRAALRVMGSAARVNYSGAFGTGPSIPMPHRSEGFGANTTVVISEVREA